MQSLDYREVKIFYILRLCVITQMCLPLQHGTNKLFTRRKGSKIRRCSPAPRSNTPCNCSHEQKFSFLNNVIHSQPQSFAPFFSWDIAPDIINTVMNIFPLVDFTISLKKKSVYNNTPALPSDTQHSTTEQMCWRMGKMGGNECIKGQRKRVGYI